MQLLLVEAGNEGGACVWLREEKEQAENVELGIGRLGCAAL